MGHGRDLAPALWHDQVTLSLIIACSRLKNATGTVTNDVIWVREKKKSEVIPVRRQMRLLHATHVSSICGIAAHLLAQSSQTFDK
jgi:hypothetical protein